MKKILVLFIALTVAMSVCACGGNTESSNESESKTESSAVTSAEDSQEAERSELEALGDVEVENGIFYVYITVPRTTLTEDADQDALNAEAGTTYTSATVKEDGSVTYKMTYQQHNEMLDELKTSIDDSISEMINDADMGITDVKYNDNLTSFDITLNSDTVSITAAFSTLVFYMYGGMYNIFTGETVDKIVVNFYSPDGTLIKSADSSSME